MSVGSPEAATFSALSHGTRRAILDRLRTGPWTTGALAFDLGASRYAVMQHLGVLVRAGLVLVRRRGRERWNHLNAVPLQRMYERWVRPYEAHWAQGLVRFQQDLERKGGDSMAEARRIENCGIVRVELEVTIDAPRARVWEALTAECGKWWPKDYYVSPKAKTFSIEPRVGGRMFEDWGEGAGVLWGNVLVFDPPSALELLCPLTPAFGGPAVTMVRLALTEKGKKTTLAISDALLGPASEKSSASLESGWRAIFGDGLKRYVERARGGRKSS